jgi:AraC-like DNA-binding protein
MELIAEASPVRQFLAYLDHIGFDEGVLNIRGLPPALRASSAPMAVSARLIVDLMEETAKALKQADLGVRFAQWLNPRSISPLSLLGEHCATYGDRFRLSRRYVHIYNSALSFDHVREGNEVVILCSVNPSLRPRARQYIEMIVAQSVRNARSMLGLAWNPRRVEFAHAAPSSIAVHRRHFRCPVEHQADRDSFVVACEDFNRRLPSEDRETVVFLENHLARQEAYWPDDLRGQVENLIAAQLAGGDVSLRRVAVLLATSPRTLQRRLAEQGTDFGEILAFVRTQVATDHLSQRPPPTLARLSHLLGYSEPSAASRFVKSAFGVPARTVAKRSLPGVARSRTVRKRSAA